MGRGYRAPLAPFHLPAIDTAKLRRRLRLSQTRFAHRFGFPVATLRHWERGNRNPGGCALALLHVINYNHALVLRAITRAKRANGSG
jgi:putative transcriptional regulator